jgi:hypothetical protein
MMHYAQYELARELASLMDPDENNFSDIITTKRDEFMKAIEMYQGLVKEDGVSQQRWDLRNSLVEMHGSDSRDVYDAIEAVGEEMIHEAPGMFADKTSQIDCENKWSIIAGRVGDPESASGGKELSNAVENNANKRRKNMADIIREQIEVFYAQPRVGISGVKQIVDASIEILKAPVSQGNNLDNEEYKYLDYFHHLKQQLPSTMDQSERDFKQQVGHAHSCSTGWIKNEDNHLKAIKNAQGFMVEYWRAHINRWVCKMGTKVIDETIRILEQESLRIERLVETLRGLQDEFNQHKAHFAKPVVSTMFIEIAARESLDSLLEPYLGSKNDKSEKLNYLLETFIKKHKYTTLAQLENGLDPSKLEFFSQQLSAFTYTALKGEKGRTRAFSLDPTDEEGVAGFVKRYSAGKALEEMPEDQLVREVENLYKMGVPWVARDSSVNPAHDAYHESYDLFVGFPPECPSTVEKKVLKIIGNVAGRKFKPQKVITDDPSQIIVFTEVHGFPVFHVDDLYGAGGMEQDYKKLLFNRNSPEALHIHRDYYNFGSVIPLAPERLQFRKRALWRFIEAQFLGLYQTTWMDMNKRENNRIRVEEVVPTKSKSIEYKNRGAEPILLNLLMESQHEVNMLQKRVDDKLVEFSKLEKATWTHLYVLAWYWQQTIYPDMGATSATGENEGEGSPEGEVLVQILEKYKQNAIEELKKKNRGVPAEDDFNSFFQHYMSELAKWTVPIAKAKGHPMPRRKAVDASRRSDQAYYNGSSQLDLIQDQLEKFSDEGWYENEFGYLERVTEFPRLAINWKAFEPQRYDYRSKVTHPPLPGVPLDKIIPLILRSRDRSDNHEIKPSGSKDWQRIEDNNSLVKRLEEAGWDISVPEMQAVPKITDTKYQLATERHQLGEKIVSEIAAHINSNPEKDHQVWTQGMANWASWKTVDEILAAVSALKAPKPEPKPPTLGSKQKYHYAVNKQNRGELTVDEIVQDILDSKPINPKVWMKGFDGWKPPEQVPEIQAALEAAAPPSFDGPPAFDVPPTLDAPPAFDGPPSLDN